jgi:Xaa-Pro aminopeptidase
MDRKVSRLTDPPYVVRIAGVRAALESNDIDCLLVSSRENIRHLTGFAGSSGWVLASQDEVLLATDARYVERARGDLGEESVLLAAQGLTASVVSYVAGRPNRTLGFEGQHLSFAAVRNLEQALSVAGVPCELRSAEGIVEDLRMVKDGEEIAAITRACGLADGAIAHARAVMQTGMTERELAWRIERWLRENGSGPLPFEIIVAAGPNSAMPHAVPGERTLRPGEPVVIDLGATCDGYCSDLTRTLFLGHIAPPFDTVYRIVLEAQKAAIERVRSRMRASEADEIARRVIRDGGLEDSFTHGLGHGVGLEIHERPGVNSRSSEVLDDSMVITIEPGVYLSGQGGVRIEDTVVLRDGMAQSLARSDKEQPVVSG